MAKQQIIKESVDVSYSSDKFTSQFSKYMKESKTARDLYNMIKGFLIYSEMTNNSPAQFMFFGDGLENLSVVLYYRKSDERFSSISFRFRDQTELLDIIVNVNEYNVADMNFKPADFYNKDKCVEYYEQALKYINSYKDGIKNRIIKEEIKEDENIKRQTLYESLEEFF